MYTHTREIEEELRRTCPHEYAVALLDDIQASAHSTYMYIYIHMHRLQLRGFRRAGWCRCCTIGTALCKALLGVLLLLWQVWVSG